MISATSWEHEVVLEKIVEAEARAHYPRCVAGENACPPEDVGGVWGYVDFLQAINNPEHNQHEEFLEWVGGEFDPEKFDLDAVNELLKKSRKLRIERARHHLGGQYESSKRPTARRHRRGAQAPQSANRSAGVAITVAATAAMLVITGLAAYRFRFSAAALVSLRVFAALSVIAAVYFALVRPLRRRASDAQLARLVEEKHPGVEDRFVSAIEFSGEEMRAAFSPVIIGPPG